MLTAVGGDTCELYNVNRVQLNEIFSRISATIGVRRQVNFGVVSGGGRTGMAIQQTNTPVLSIRRRNFAVLLNLDISGSMEGARFNSLKASVQNFLRNLDGNDLASCIVFNNKVQLISQYGH